MHKLIAIAIVSCCTNSAQAQLNSPKIYELSGGRVTSTTTAVFDTIATYVEGKVVDLKTQQPIEGATIKMNYQDAFKTQARAATAASDKEGVFKLGWVGTGKNRLLTIRAAKYKMLTTEKVEAGGLTELRIELLAIKK
jgi:hypothetical protein